MAEPLTKRAAIEVPRDVANKSDKRRLLRAIRMALEVESPAVRRNTQELIADAIPVPLPSSITMPSKTALVPSKTNRSRSSRN